MNIPESIQRRDFIKQLGLASTAALTTNGTQAWGSEKYPSGSQGGFLHPIWMAGGWRHLILLIPKIFSL